MSSNFRRAFGISLTQNKDNSRSIRDYWYVRLSLLDLLTIILNLIDKFLHNNETAFKIIIFMR